MELINATKMVAGYTMGMDPSGRESVVVAVKGTFLIPSQPDEIPKLADEQVELVMADEFTGEPGYSSTLYESDFAAVKPNCDVLLNGSAYAPGGKPTQRVQVGLRVGSMSKSFDVVGNRVWQHTGFSAVASEPEPFVKMPITYDNAFGGMDETSEDPNKHTSYQPNHVGTGYHGRPNDKSVEGIPLPNTEESGKPIKEPNGKYRPMSFGAIARSWQPRLKYAGTYDQNWMDNVFPFLPEDFDNLYYQAAPPDQQIPYPKGGETVELVSVISRGTTTFRIPDTKLPIEFTIHNFEITSGRAAPDTILIEPDLRRFTITWRAAHPLKRNIKEIRQCVIGQMPKGWYRARQNAKRIILHSPDSFPSEKLVRRTGHEAASRAGCRNDYWRWTYNRSELRCYSGRNHGVCRHPIHVRWRVHSRLSCPT